MKLKTTKQDYNFIRLDYIDDQKRIIPILGLWKRKDRFGTYYENDRNGKTFKTIKEAKEYALKHFKN